MAKQRKLPIRAVLTVAALAFALAFFGPLEIVRKYLNFSALNEQKLIVEAENYIDERAGGNQMACLYVVSCDEEQARLELVQDIRTLDFTSVKRGIWDRRTSSFCPGRTANIALHLIPKEGEAERIESTALSRWSFFNDRFIPIRGRFQSGAFTDQSWERCTPQSAIIRNPQRLTRSTPQTPPPA